MRAQILVIGYSADHCTQKAYDLAYDVGREVARTGSILISGGLGGVMEAASKGAQGAGGIVVGIIPQEEKSNANAYCDVVIPTGLGYARDFLTAYAADGVIIIGGGVGTTIEACVAYSKSKPIVAIRGSGGTADRLADTHLDDRKLVQIIGVDGPKEAVAYLAEIGL